MINTLKHLCYTLKTFPKELDSVINNIEKYYYEKIEIKKHKDGSPKLQSNGIPKKRIINPSIKGLKHLQKMILLNILNGIELPEYIYGAAKGIDNVMNAKRHQGNKYIFTTDLKDFFPRINNKMVFCMFRSRNFSPTVARILTQLVTYKGHLPQGAPTSSMIANLVFIKTGNNLDVVAKENNIRFTTFIDDLTFSSKRDFKHIVPSLLEIIRNDQFLLSHNKTNYKTKNPLVTGVLVKNNSISIPSSFREKMLNTKGLTKSQVKGLIQYSQKVESFN